MTRVRRAAVLLARGLIWAYPAALFAVFLFLRATAEKFWVSALCVYLPPQGYLVPAPILLLLALWAGPRRLLLVPVAGVLFVLFFMMGFQISWRDDERTDLTVVTMNVDSSYRGADEVVAGIVANQPDVVFLQEIGLSGPLLVEALKRKLPHVIVSHQFVVASRFPLSEPADPEMRFLRGRMRLPQFISLSIFTPQGEVRAYNVHPLSPRHAFMAVRGQGFRKEIQSGRLLRGEAADLVYKNIEIRRFELETAARYAARETLPTILAGDFNLTQMSPLFDAAFGEFSDSFSDAGNGFGFTFPSKILFLRLDRILAIHGPRFVDSFVSCKGLSDHICVVAKIELSPR